MLMNIERSLRNFTPISLDELNGKAGMMERLDNKYVIREADLVEALGDFSELFDVLEISGKRMFNYVTQYFDDEGLCSYHDHQRGRRKRCKVRVRSYNDSGACFVEIKLKDKRGITIKKRMELASHDPASLDDNAMAFVRRTYESLYHEPFRHRIGPVISMQYQRMTLVAKQGGERLTIDGAINLRGHNSSLNVPDGILILESKSARGNGVADKILRKLHQHPVPRCSKYCVGMAALGQVGKFNTFLPALRRLEISPPVPALTNREAMPLLAAKKTARAFQSARGRLGHLLAKLPFGGLFVKQGAAALN